MTNKSKIIIGITSTLLIALIAAVSIFYFAQTHPIFESISAKEFAIPGLNTKFVPQGLTYDSNSSNYFITGYMSDNSDSRIYIVNESNLEDAKYVTITYENKSPKGHMGGIAIYNSYVYIASDGYVYRLMKDNLTSASNGAEISVIDCFKTNNGADNIVVYNSKLYVGEFYLKNKYNTPSTHHIEVANGETNKALTFVYELNTSNNYGVKSTTPVYGISMPDKVQGFAFNSDGKIILSTSYSIDNSHILVYDNPIDDNKAIYHNIAENTSIPIYPLSSENLLNNLEIPSMSEEIIVKDSKVYILFESACKKWKMINRTRMKNVYSIEVSKLLEIK